ncbi:MarR family transcriptional regulator [Rhodovastum atsumiense]|uniref:MarR family transcriptional regulator n=2 Tax=Rhodovastum atsumiense TaxID=504468 RepID=A0A5M6IID8_9PROT|nr:MarR family transcriptional regulator [Rhodovastum atsumiense]
MTTGKTPFGFTSNLQAPALETNGLVALPESEDVGSGNAPVPERLVTLHGTLLALVRRDGRDLTARQLTAFMTVYLDNQVHTVSSMAELLNISRPGVTRLLDRLAEYDLVERQEDRNDRRRVLIRRTVRGTAFLRELEEIARTAPALVHA